MQLDLLLGSQQGTRRCLEKALEKKLSHFPNHPDIKPACCLHLLLPNVLLTTDRISPDSCSWLTLQLSGIVDVSS